MANLQQFQTYDQQTAELQRRQRMAELLQQQAMQPLESQVAPGGMVVPTSPLLGLSKMLQAYMGGKAQQNIEKQRGEMDQRSRTEAQDFLKTITQGQQQPMSPDAALAASLSAAPTEAQRVPLGGAERQQALLQASMSGNPRMAMAAQLLSQMKPERVLQLDKIDPSKFTPQSLAAAMQADNPTMLVPVEKKPELPSGVEEYNFAKSQGFSGTYTDWKRQLAEATRAPAAPEPLNAVIGPDGKPIYVTRSQALGKTPFTATTAAQEQRAINQEQANKSASISTQQALDLAADLYQDPNRESATGFSSVLNNIPGTKARDFQAKLNTFKAQTFIPMVSALKGMGALSDAEGKKLSESIGALDPAMSEDAFAQSLKTTTRFLYDKAVAAGLNVSLPDFAAEERKKTAPPPPGFVRQGGGK